jgi:hypothetical protein
VKYSISYAVAKWLGLWAAQIGQRTSIMKT